MADDFVSVPVYDKEGRYVGAIARRSYWNWRDQAWADECAEMIPVNAGHLGGSVLEERERWYIKIGFAGFNSPANNRSGYASKTAAEAACLRYQGKGKHMPLTHNVIVVKEGPI